MKGYAMKHACSATILVLGGVILLPVLAEDKKSEMPDDMQQFFVGMIYRGDKWSPEVTDESRELQKAHLANISKLAESGQMVLAGPFGGQGDLRGLFFYNVKTLAEARELADSDPAVKAGRLRVELLPWWGPKALTTLLKK
jgi:uncharacterized protein YciI